MIELVYDIKEAYPLSVGPGHSWVWPGNDFYLVTCHGNENGCLFVRAEDEDYEIDPVILQGMIWSKLYDVEGGYDKNKEIKVVCCYPAAVKEFYGTTLQAHNMMVLGDWNEPTRIVGEVLFQIWSESEYDALGGTE